MEISRRTMVSGGLLAVASPARAQENSSRVAATKGPLTLREQGTFFVGGTIERREPNTSVANDTKFLSGDIAVNQMYVEYQIPETLKYKYPIVMLHGGGHTGNVYRTTPDGREGWFTSFARRGFAVYVVDAPNRGRSGWDPTNRFAVSTGRKSPSALEPGNIYSAETAWTGFRLGPVYGSQYPGQQFPIDHLREYLSQLVASYRDPIQNDLIARSLQALVDRIGPCILLGWSTGSGNVMVAGSARASRVKAIIAIEGVPPDPTRSKVDETELAKIPFLSLFGDNPLPRNPDLAYQDTVETSKAFTQRISKLGGDATTISLPEAGIKGNSHVMMLERNNDQIADLIEQWIGKHVRE